MWGNLDRMTRIAASYDTISCDIHMTRQVAHFSLQVESIGKGAEDPASFRQMNHVNISPDAKFANRDMSKDEFLEYFCGRKS